MMETYLCYYELHVDNRTFYIHVLIEATDVNSAIEKLRSERGDNYHLQAKGCLGKFTPEMAKKYLVDPQKPLA